MWLYHNVNVKAMEILKKIKELFKEYTLKEKGWCDFAVEETVVPSYNQEDFKFRYLFLLMLRTLRNTVNLSKFNCLFLAPAYCLIVSCVKRLLTDVFIERNDQHYLFCKLFKH